MRYYIGCSGWRNVKWKEEFYPSELDPSNYLSFYATAFDFVEVNLGNSNINSSDNNNDNNYYKSLSAIARKWHKQTPESFRFSVKVPQQIIIAMWNNTTGVNSSNNNPIYNSGQPRLSVGDFLEKLAPIEEKVLSVLIETPQSLTLAQGREWLENILSSCSYHGYSVAVHFCHHSWYQDLTYNILKRHSASLVWSDLHPNTVVTSDFLYLRLNGSNNQTLWIDKLKEMAAKTITTTAQESSVDYVMITLDSPSAVNGILKLLGMPERRAGFALKNHLDKPYRTSLAAPSSSVIPQPRPDSAKGDATIGNTRTRSVDEESMKTKVEKKREDWWWYNNQARIIMCVDLNAFYPSCEELRNPSLKGKPHAVIMTDQKPGNGTIITKGVVSSCSYEARKYGVGSAMPLSRAKSLCPELILLPVDMPYYRQISEQVMAIIEEYADVLEQASIDEAFLDCTANIKRLKEAKNVGAEAVVEEYAAEIKAAVKERSGGLSCSIGVAPTKSAAKIASDYKKPDGLTVIHPSELKDFLAPLEVSRISGIGPKTQEALKKMGIATIGQLGKADVQILSDMFGKNGLWMWKVANGTDDEPVIVREDHVSLSTECTLDTFTKDRQTILNYLNELVDEIYQRTKNYHYLFRTVGVKLVRTDFSVETRETTFQDFQNSRESISSVLEQLLDRFSLLNDNSKPAIRKVGLKVSHLTAADKGESQSRKSKSSTSAADVQRTLFDYL